MKGINEQLDVGICGHQKEFLFKCPRRKEHIKCVQCAICLIGSKDSETCSSLMGDRPDYDNLPEMTLETYSQLK